MQADFLELESDSAAPLRKAAMLLHSMTAPDRQWMLARIDQPQRQRLEALLAELAALEFPVDADLVRESLAAAEAWATMPAPRPMDLSVWSADDAVQMLSPEPDDLIALLLRAGNWTWASALRARLGDERLRAVEASRYSTASEVSAVLLDAVTKAALTRFSALQEAQAWQGMATVSMVARRAS